MTFSKIDPFQLPLHRTVRFTHDLKELPDEIRGPFLVFSALGEDYEMGRRLLKSPANKLIEYSPARNMLGDRPLPFRWRVEVQSERT